MKTQNKQINSKENAIAIKCNLNNDIIFKYSCVKNTIYKTATEAVKRGVNLSDADFSESNLKGVDFSNAKLTGANFSGANLKDANFIEAKGI